MDDKNFDLDMFGLNEPAKEIAETEKSPKEKKPKKEKKEKKSFSTKQVVLIAVAVFVIAIAGVTAILCSVNDVNPFTYVSSVVSNDKKAIIGKWQSQDAPGLSAYVFYEDGTYDSYISSFNFSGKYKVQGDKLILTNTATNESVVYKMSVSSKVLSITLYQQGETKLEDKQENLKFDKVDELNQKTLSDLIGNITTTSESKES